MEKELFKQEFGEAGFDLAFKEGKLRLTLSYDGKGADAGMYVDVDPDYFLDKLAKAIPGEIDDVVINLIKSALK